MFSVLAGDAGAAGQVSDFKIKQISVELCFHGIFSLMVHRYNYIRDGAAASIPGKKSALSFALSDLSTRDN
jgi:hypothetical protein